MSVDPAAPPVLRMFHHPDARDLALRWADRFELVAAPQPPPTDGFYLWVADDLLTLRHGVRRGAVAVTGDELARRAAQGGMLARACVVRDGERLTVLDAMAGWGVDGLVLAQRGGRVVMVERHPALAALAEDLTRRSGISDVTCRCGDGMTALADGPFDVIFLDPMFPLRGKEALPGKRLQWLAELTTADSRPLTMWLQQAMRSARQRVVLKRRRRDPQVLVPDWQIVGRTVRYDVFRGMAP